MSFPHLRHEVTTAHQEQGRSKRSIQAARVTLGRLLEVAMRQLLLLLVITTSICGCQSHPIDEDRQAIENIERLGGRVYKQQQGRSEVVYSVSFAQLSVDARDLRTLLRFPDLSRLYFTESDLGDKGIKNIRGLKRLEFLDLMGTRITDDSLANVASLTSLKELVLARTAITDDGVKELSKLHNLEILWMNNTKITNKSFNSIRLLPRLRSLYLSDTEVSDEGLKLLSSLSGLTELNVANTKVSRQGVIELQAALPKLTIVDKRKQKREQQ